MAGSEGRCEFRSPKWSAAMLVATIAALFVCGPSLSYADQSTPKLLVSSDWTQWTKEECDAMWIHSPWGMPGSELRSALPVREAILRETQLAKHYDTMTPQKKLAFDKKNPSDMTENENDPIVLYVQHDSENTDVYDFDTGWGTLHYNPAPATEVALQLADGTLVMPIKTEAIQNDTDRNRTMYSFPRVVNGKPVLTLNDQSLNFVIGQALTGGGRIRPLQDPKKFSIASAWVGPDGISFRTADLVYNGKLEF